MAARNATQTETQEQQGSADNNVEEMIGEGDEEKKLRSLIHRAECLAIAVATASTTLSPDPLLSAQRSTAGSRSSCCRSSLKRVRTRSIDERFGEIVIAVVVADEDDENRNEDDCSGC